MSQNDHPSRLRFDSFDLDLHTGELRKDGRPIKLQDQPVKLLSLLIGRAGELVTRDEIEKALWGEDQFVEFEHGINTAMRKIREALGDDPEKPRYIETLPRKGYRFLVPVEAVEIAASRGALPKTAPVPVQKDDGESAISSRDALPADPPGAEFALPRARARILFLLIQSGYLAIYVAALYKMESLEEVLGVVLLLSAGWVAPLAIVAAVAAGCGIAVRLYLISSVGLDHPEAGRKYQRIFPLLFLLDTFWAASPLLLSRKMGYGLALGCVAALAYLPFAQRTLVLSINRGANSPDGRISPA